MCGICGFSGFRDDELLKKMSQKLIHRGPDEYGFFISPKTGLAIRRLSIIDLETGTQPIFNEDKSLVLIFNGEIYNHSELRSYLIKKGHIFKSRSDTETIIHLYEEKKEEFPKYLRGMFAVALWDSKEDKLVLARDHFGIKPLFYFYDSGKLIFSSEIKSLLISKRLKKEIDPHSVDLYFRFLYYPGEKTIFKSVKKLLPGHILIFKKGGIKLKNFWRYSAKPNYKINEEECIEKAKFLLKESVKEQRMADVPLGILLSGGLDSSAITALLSEMERKVKTFSVVYEKEDEDFDEGEKARKIADIFKTEHFEFKANPKIEEVLNLIVEGLDEPFADSSFIPTFLISDYAHKEVKTALTGIGGDELFGGYPRYLGARLLPIYLNLPLLLRKNVSKFSELFKDEFGSANRLQRIKRFLRGGRGDFSEAYASWVLYSSQVNILNPDFYRFSESWAPGNIFKEIRSPDDIAEYEFENYLPEDLLYLSDRASMLNSLELRVPFLDVRLVEFMSQVPLSLKTRRFRLKYLLKKMFEDTFPRQIINQRKMGFQIPLARWINSDLKDLINEYLSEKKVNEFGILKYDYVKNILEMHRSGKANLYDQIYSVLVFNIWMEKNRL